MADQSLGHWRVGRHQTRNLYYTPDGTAEKETFRGVFFDPEEAPRVAEALNGSHSPELAVALEFITAFVDDNPCRYDHNNHCQEHGWYDDAGDPEWRCPHQEAKKFLDAHGIDWVNQ